MTRTTPHHITLLTSATLALTMASAQAASPAVDAGVLLRQAEQGIKTSPKSATRKSRKATPSAVVAPSEATVQIRAFNFIGNRLISHDELSRALVSFQNRPLTLSQLREAADAVTNIYREAGWTVRAFLPKQEIANGVVSIQIVEAVFGGAQLQSASPERIDADRLLDIAEANLVKGQTLHASQLDRTLLLLNDLPGVSVTGNLVPGLHDGETNLAINVTDEPLITGNLSIDNQGSRSTGHERLSANININSPARLGDLLNLNLLKTQGTEYERFNYSVPVGKHGWRAGIQASHLNYDILNSYKPDSGIHGKATTTGVDASYPIVRSQILNLRTNLAYTHRTFENYVSSNLDSNYKASASTLTISGSQLDNLGNGGNTNGSIQITSGEVDRSHSVDLSKDQDTTGLKTNGYYSKLNLNLSRVQTLTPELSAFVAITHQVASKNLDSSEKIYLGGAYGVRAYPSNEAGGSEGTTLTLELHQRIGSQWLLTGFYDYGWIRSNVKNYNATTPNSFDMQGYGMSVAYQLSQFTNFKATLAQRIGQNPIANTTTGMDSDGTKKTTRVWLSTTVTF